MMETTLVPSPVLTQIQAILGKDANADCIALVWPEPIELTKQRLKSKKRDLIWCIASLNWPSANN